MARVETALVSVADKTGLAGFARRLVELGVELVATGGTADYLRSEGIEPLDTSEFTGKVEFLGGLVKTLHPAIHGGILADRGNPGHMAEIEGARWRKIDMVVVNFYPLGGGPMGRDLSFIDIGGPSMARAAAKNFPSCVPVPDPSWYRAVVDEMGPQGEVGEDLRWKLAVDALARTREYDAAILEIAGEEAISGLPGLAGLRKALDLRYGENPHQVASLLSRDGKVPFEVLKGELSYNNLLDVDCCLAQLGEFEGNAAVVVKHVGPCGVAAASGKADALEWAYACDPLSAFGGVIGVNFTFTEECADLLAKRFIECIVAPAFGQDALAKLRKKKRTRLVAAEPLAGRSWSVRSIFAGVLTQACDDVLLVKELDFVAGERPGDELVEDMLFAWKAVKHVKSNAIVFAREGRTLGIGAGQPSRVDATRIAIEKAGEHGHDLGGSVVASDGFFPFPDSIELAAAAGARYVVQPGGSIRDAEVTARARDLGLTMALTGTRHFRH
jgi:phosphoribosylaminoimidazolecarboxamide formyltransferase/IMP cyclohydrolase